MAAKSVGAAAATIVTSLFFGVLGDIYAEPVSIMPFGDSITNGYHGVAGERGAYRHYLADQLNLLGFEFDFVGEFRVGGDGLTDRDVQARGGYRIEQMTELFNGAVATHQPDVMLILAGTNNHWSDPAVTDFPTLYSDLIASIHEVSPDSQLIFSTVPQLACCRSDKDYWTEQWVEERNGVRIPNINTALESVVGQRDDLALVDLHAEIDVETDIVTFPEDHVHLNAIGQSKLGRLFLGELLSLERGFAKPEYIDSLARAIREGGELVESLRYKSMDEVAGLTPSDYYYFVESVVGIPVGDVNFDGSFTSADIVAAFTSGSEYEDAVKMNSTWATGDWDGDGEFTSRDLVVSLQRSVYEPRSAVPVPEPRNSLEVLFLGHLAWLYRLRVKQRKRTGGGFSETV